MEKQKIYVFMIPNLNIEFAPGGAEMYTMGKARYLHGLGWKVFVFTTSDKSKITFPHLNDYVTPLEGCRFLSVPPYKLSRPDIETYLDLMVQKLEIRKKVKYFEEKKKYEIIIESISQPLSYWAELFAALVGGRHFVALVEEHYRYPTSRHEENLDFFYFKWKRNELMGCKKAFAELFNGYKNITDELVEVPDTIREQDAVQDVEAPNISQIEKRDWNICHIGRITKNYVTYLIEGVAELAKHYPNRTINFIFVGDAQWRLNFIHKTFEDVPNVQLIFLGNLFPIPRVLFSKVDVVCGISQSARFAANEGVFTIVASSVNIDRTPGLLGYDTKEQVRGEGTFTYFEALENVLEKKIYDKMTSTLPKLEPAEKYYEKFWSILNNADPDKEYFTDRFMENRIRHFAAVFPFDSIARGTRVIFFGATEIASDYRQQIETQYKRNLMDCGNWGIDAKDQKNSHIEIGPTGIKEVANEPYCHILATVDPHPENFDDSVVGYERLKQLDYDAIVITTYTWDAQDAIKIILDIVPQMADRIVCNLQFFEVYWAKERRPVYIDF